MIGPTEKCRDFVLYRWFDKDENLLYVGATGNIGRIGDHARKARPWVKMATHITLEHFDSLEDVREAEKSAIRTENPIFNKRRYVSQ